jgi:hypothetical protein
MGHRYIYNLLDSTGNIVFSANSDLIADTSDPMLIIGNLIRLNRPKDLWSKYHFIVWKDNRDIYFDLFDSASDDTVYTAQKDEIGPIVEYDAILDALVSEYESSTMSDWTYSVTLDKEKRQKTQE